MPTPDGRCTSKRDDEPETAVLVLTDGSTRAQRVAEWGLVFTDTGQATVHRIDVIDCLDSGVIIHRHEESVQNGRGNSERRPTNASTNESNRIRGHESATEVLHGVPHEALLDYVASNAIDLIVIGVRDRTYLSHSSIGNTLSIVSQTAAVPVITTRTREYSETRCG